MKKRARKIYRPLPVGAKVELIQTGATGVVVKHVKANLDDRPHKLTEKVKWDSYGSESYVRPGRLRLV